jgi:hypothetical protein
MIVDLILAFQAGLCVMELVRCLDKVKEVSAF